MTIVLQHRFWDLFVQADRFEVKLTFDSIRERLVIPFAAVRVFFDPSVPYGLQFDEPMDGRTGPMGEMLGFPGRSARAAGRAQPERSERPAAERKKMPRKPKADPTADVVTESPVTGIAKSAPPATAPLVDAAPPPAAPAARTGPRLVETANDSAKVVSLDQFRKK